jgi:uncharacterized protein YqjF (DUF2071 family)
MEPESPRRWPFLTARWSNLFLANYRVPDGLLQPRLPPGLQLDRHDGLAFVSLVAFDFLDTRVLGVPWPGYRNFPEVNLRFYVRDGDRRGVVFVRELVPHRLVAFLARVFYNEPYMALPMTSTVTDADDAITIEHRLTGRGRVHTIRATGAKPATRPAAESVAHFFKEHQWGFGRSRRGATLRYEVRHSVWDAYQVRDYHIDLDWVALYGPEWAVLADARPDSTVLAVGSPVAVYPQAGSE